MFVMLFLNFHVTAHANLLPVFFYLFSVHTEKKKFVAFKCPIIFEFIMFTYLKYKNKKELLLD